MCYSLLLHSAAAEPPPAIQYQLSSDAGITFTWTVPASDDPDVLAPTGYYIYYQVDDEEDSYETEQPMALIPATSTTQAYCVVRVTLANGLYSKPSSPISYGE